MTENFGNNDSGNITVEQNSTIKEQDTLAYNPEVLNENKNYQRMNDIVEKTTDNPFTVGNKEFYSQKVNGGIKLAINVNNRQYTVSIDNMGKTRYEINGKVQNDASTKRDIDDFIKHFNQSLDIHLQK